MTWKQTRAVANALIAQLPLLPHPWDIFEFRERLALHRGRELLFHPIDLPALPSGLWYDDGHADHIIYRARTTGYHRDHVILHEICHMLFRAAQPNRFNSDHARTTGDLIPALRRHLRRGRCRDSEEELAEMFASCVLKRALCAPPPTSTFEWRTAAVFGVA